MLTSLRFESFRSLADVTIRLEQFTVLVGPNGAGKTSVLRGLQMLAASVKAGLGTFNPGVHQTKGSTKYPGLVAVVDDSFTIVVEAYALTWGQRDGVANPPPHDALDRVVRSQSLSLNADQIRLETHLSTPAVLQPSGAGLASVLAALALSQPTAIAVIARDLASVVPHARDMRPLRVQRSGPDDTFAFEVEFDGVGWIAGTEVSEGTAIALALITLLHLENPPELLLIDDIDRGLHPQAQRELVAILRRLLRRRPQTQIVATTHSPYLLDAFKPEEVCILNLGVDGHSVCRRLADHPEIDKWRDAMASGELWASLGEDWIREPAGGS